MRSNENGDALYHPRSSSTNICIERQSVIEIIFVLLRPLLQVAENKYPDLTRCHPKSIHCPDPLCIHRPFTFAKDSLDKVHLGQNFGTYSSPTLKLRHTNPKSEIDLC
jgi:hypothetical protein